MKNVIEGFLCTGTREGIVAFAHTHSGNHLLLAAGRCRFRKGQTYHLLVEPKNLIETRSSRRGAS